MSDITMTPELEEKLTGIINEGLKTHLPDTLPNIVDAQVKNYLDNNKKKFPGLNEEKAMTTKLKVAEFVQKVFRRDPSLKTMEEDTDSAGGYLVPEEVAAEVDRVIENYGLIRKLARNIPMKRDIMNMPILGGAATVSWPGEGNAGADGSPTLQNVKMTAKTAVGLSPITNELLADANLSVVDLLLELFGEALAGAEDEQALTGTGAPFTGILESPEPTVVQMASGKDLFSEADLDDYRDLISQIKPTALPGCVYVMHRNIWAYVQKITENSQHVSTFQNPLVTGKPEGGKLVPVGYLWGYPVYTSDHMPSATAVSTNFVIFGNFKHFYFGNRQEMTMDISKEATVGSVNAFASNHSIVRVLERVALHVGIGEAFALLKTAAS